MVKVNKVLMSLAALATVRANEPIDPNYPGEPIQPLAPSEPFDFMQYASYIDPNILGSIAGSLTTNSIVNLATSYITGAPAEEKKEPGYLESAVAMIPGGTAALDGAKAAYDSVAEYVPEGLDVSSYFSPIAEFASDNAWTLSAGAALTAVAGYFNYIP